MNAQRNHAVLQNAGEVEISGRVVGWVAAEDDEEINFAAAHVGYQILDRLGLVDRIRVDPIGIENGLADVAQLCIDCVRKSMNRGGLMIPRNDGARTRMSL